MRRPRAVLADDHAAIAEVCERLLAPYCDVVAAARTGPEALAAVAEHGPDLLVLDVSMPGLSGLQVADRLRDDPVRIVILTLHRERVIADRAFAQGALAYVTKARMARDLVPAVQAALAGRRFCSPLPDGSAI